MSSTLILVVAMIWMPLLPLRLVLHFGIRLWRKVGAVAFGMTLVYWVLFDLWILLQRDNLIALRFWTPEPVRWTGLFIAAGAFFLHLWTIQTLGLVTFLTKPEVMPAQSVASLITSGPYRFVRHPFYVIEWLFLFGIGLATASWLVWILLVLAAGTSPWVTASEERELVERFGESYREYQNRVPRLLPRFRRD